MTKVFSVFWRDELVVHQWHWRDVTLSISPAKPLRPQMARLVAAQAVGQDHGVIVWSNDEYGYALYPETHRRIPYRGINLQTNPAQDGAGH